MDGRCSCNMLNVHVDNGYYSRNLVMNMNIVRVIMIQDLAVKMMFKINDIVS